MEQAHNAPGNASARAPLESKIPTILRSVGIGVFVLILWWIDKAALRRFPEGAAWRYVIGAIVISVGLATVILIADRLNNKNS